MSEIVRLLSENDAEKTPGGNSDKNSNTFSCLMVNRTKCRSQMGFRTNIQLFFCLLLMPKEGLTLYSCNQMFTSTHYGDESHID